MSISLELYYYSNYNVHVYEIILYAIIYYFNMLFSVFLRRKDQWIDIVFLIYIFAINNAMLKVNGYKCVAIT